MRTAVSFIQEKLSREAFRESSVKLLTSKKMLLKEPEVHMHDINYTNNVARDIMFLHN